MNNWQRSVFEMFGEHFGEFYTYDNTDGGMTIEFSDLERIEIPPEVMRGESPEGFARYILQLFTDKYADRSVIMREIERAPLKAKDRIQQINDELDIIRGVVPTPKHYKINVKRTKSLMTELNELIKKDNPYAVKVKKTRKK